VEPLIAGAAVALLALWVSANRRHVARRTEQTRDWGGAGDRPDLWTSAARCPNCAESGGRLSMMGDELWFTCLACGQRHRREHKG
jgi:hypothetical protein